MLVRNFLDVSVSILYVIDFYSAGVYPSSCFKFIKKKKKKESGNVRFFFSSLLWYKDWSLIKFNKD
jgi:hypothetical protein